ncbi:MAG: hypothetical protein M0Z66_16350 [Thermaerobacter sp.]|nr:hypothetical protein [Thermaerobacter sp.]
MSSEGRAAGLASDVPSTVALLQAAAAQGIWSDPPLTGIMTARFEEAAMEILGEGEAELFRQLGGAQRRSVGGIPASDGLRRIALHELCIGTALVAQSRASGNLDVSEESARIAVEQILGFADQTGAQALVHVYWLHATSLNYRALRYYGEMRIEDFTSGRLHRPWCDWLLTEELRAGLALEEIEPVSGRPGAVRLTERGLAVTSALEEDFQAARVQRARRILREGSVRNLATGARLGLRRTFPGIVDYSEELGSVLAGLLPMRRAIEVGSVSGVLAGWAVDGRLGDAEAICCGSSQGRLLQVLHDYGGRVQIAQYLADGSLPFADGSADLAVLPATPLRIWLPSVLGEVRRVLGLGGHVMLLTSTGWLDALPLAVRRALPQFAVDFLSRTDAVRPAAAARDAGYEVLLAKSVPLQGEVTSGEGLYALLGETGLLAEIERTLPIAEAERCEDEAFDACAAALRAAHGRLRFELRRETVVARR